MRNAKQVNNNCLHQNRRLIWKHAWISAIRAGSNLAVLNTYNILLRGILAWCKKAGFFFNLFVLLFSAAYLNCIIQFLVVKLFVDQFFCLNLSSVKWTITHMSPHKPLNHCLLGKSWAQDEQINLGYINGMIHLPCAWPLIWAPGIARTQTFGLTLPGWSRVCISALFVLICRPLVNFCTTSPKMSFKSFKVSWTFT